jgi:hypothetical protein
MPLRLLVVVLGVVLMWVPLAAAREPMLLTARPSGGHIVVTFVPGDLIPAQVEVSTRATRASTGGFVAGNVKIRERMTVVADQAPGTDRYRTRGTVRPGTYYVAVSGALQEPPPSCIPLRSRCNERWSNTLQVTVRP